MCFELAKDLQFLSVNTPPVRTGTLVTIRSNTLYVNWDGDFPTTDQYFAGAIVWTSGPSQGLSSGLLGNAADQLYVAGAFTGSHQPQPGDTFQVSGGPLSRCKVYMIEPDTVAGAGDFLVTVTAVSQSLSWRTMGKKLKAWLNLEKNFQLEVVCEAPYKVSTDEDLAGTRNDMLDLYLLKEQCEIIIVNFRMNEENRIRGNGDVESAYAMIQRTGSGQLRHAAIIEFGVTQT